VHRLCLKALRACGRVQVDLLAQASGFQLDQKLVQARMAAAASKPTPQASSSRGSYSTLLVAGSMAARLGNP
jgi:hypothetical protein